MWLFICIKLAYLYNETDKSDKPKIYTDKKLSDKRIEKRSDNRIYTIIRLSAEKHYSHIKFSPNK